MARATVRIVSRASGSAPEEEVAAPPPDRPLDLPEASDARQSYLTLNDLQDPGLPSTQLEPPRARNSSLVKVLDDTQGDAESTALRSVSWTGAEEFEGSHHDRRVLLWICPEVVAHLQQVQPNPVSHLCSSETRGDLLSFPLVLLLALCLRRRGAGSRRLGNLVFDCGCLDEKAFACALLFDAIRNSIQFNSIQFNSIQFVQIR